MLRRHRHRQFKRNSAWSSHHRQPHARLSFECLEERIALNAGDLDTTFGNGGIVQTSISPNYDVIQATAVQPNGDIVVGGTAYNVPEGNFTLARYTPTGRLDTSFGAGGIVEISLSDGAKDSSDIKALAVQSDGKIVAMGGAIIDNTYELATARFDSDGSLDTTFGSGGRILHATGSNTFADYYNHALVIQTDGKILVAFGSNPQGFMIDRYNTDGTFDSTFGTNGTVYVAVASDSSDDFATGLALQPDGKIIVVGLNQLGQDNDFRTVRLNANGTLDTSFGTGGYVLTGIGNGFSAAESVALQSNGKIIIAGSVIPETGNSEGAVVRYDADGTLDTTFGIGGELLLSSNGNLGIYSLHIEPNGEFLASGSLSEDSTSSVVLAQITSSGSLDPRFGTNGFVIEGTNLFPEATSLENDGRIIVAGGAGDSFNPDFFVMRLFNSPPATVGLPDLNVLAPTISSAFPLNQYFTNVAQPLVPLTYSITADTDPGLFSSAAIDQESGTLTLTYAGTAFGSSSITVRATDAAGQYVETTFVAGYFTGAPSFVKGPDVTVDENSGPQTITGWATQIKPGPNLANPSFTFQVGTDRPDLFSVAPTIDSQGNLTFTPATDAFGMAAAFVILKDNGGTAGGRSDTSLLEQTFSLTVNLINRAPMFSVGPNQTVSSSAGQQIIANWATGISPGPASESNQTLSFDVTADRSQMFSIGPSISPDGTLTYAPNPDAQGLVTLSVALKDNGGTANGGHDTSSPQTFTILIDPVNHAPTFVAGSNVSVDAGAGPATVPNWATQISAGTTFDANQILTFQVTNNLNSFFAEQPRITPDGTLHFIPAPNAFGSVNVTVTLVDNGGTANGGQDTSATHTFTITVQNQIHPLSSIPALDSLPRSAAKLYLNFTGDNTPTWGSHSPGVTPAYDSDGDATTFSDSELLAIRQIWAQVADAFSPFQLDVTTVDPGNLSDKQTLRVDIGGTGSWLAAPEGGVAFVGSFYNSQPNIVFVFSTNQNNGEVNGTAVTIEHEAGHAFGLEHQSLYSGTTLVQEYNPGTRAAGPIMGAPFNSTYARWWDGPTDVSSTTIQDDMAVIASAANGFGFRADDHPNNTSAATPLTLSNGILSGSGVIETSQDVDVFSFTTAGGIADFIISPVVPGGTLAPSFVVTDSNFDNLLNANHPSGYLAAGTYYLDITSDNTYGNVGQYTIRGTTNVDPVVLTSTTKSVFENAPPTSFDLSSVFSDPLPGSSALQFSVVSTAGGNLIQGTPVLDAANGTLTVAVNPGVFGLVSVIVTAQYSNDAPVQATFRLLVSQPFTLGDNGTLDLADTSGNDRVSIAFLSATGFTVTLDGITQSFDTSTVRKIEFNGFVGNDTLIVTDTTHARSAQISGGAISFVGPDLDIEAGETEYIYLYGSASDSATLSQGPTADLAIVTPTYGYLTGPGNAFFYQVAGFGIAKFTAPANSNDMAFVYSAAGGVVQDNPTTLTLSLNGATSTLTNFQQTYVQSYGGANDQAYLFGTTGNDAFIGTPYYAYLTGTAGGVSYFNEVINYRNVNVYGNGGNDVAHLYDSSGNDLYVSTPTYAYLIGGSGSTQFFNEVVGFATVVANSSQGGNDAAYLYDSAGNDTFTSSAGFSNMSAGGTQSYAYGFGLVIGESTAGGSDSAILDDGPGSNNFFAYNSPPFVQMARITAATNAYAFGFANVTAIQSAGDNDHKFADAVDYALTFDGTWL